ncbi:translocation/assembly module TamB domain-containing protein [Azospirillum sp. A39]|uniref:translocation/assembly module TamB domain-containing protein n=1 Tax=Azospirillum sp. A39 TaxID=3462279 RepID=UPI0040462A68
MLPATAGLVLLTAAAMAQDDGSRSGVRGWIAGTIEKLVSGPDLQVRIGEISGFVPFNFRVSTVSVADRDGEWLRLEGLHLNLAPSALFSGRLGADAIEAARVVVERAPAASAAAPPPEEEPGGPASLLPDLPIGVQVDRLAVDELRLGAPLLGEAAVLRIAGRDIVLSSGGSAVSADLDVERIDDKPGQASLDVAFRPEDQTLDLGLQVSEPAGGVIARAAGLPGLPPVEVRVDGSGTLADWRGTLVAAAADLLLNAEATIRAENGGHRLALDAGGNLAPLVAAYAGPDMAPLVGGEPRVHAEVLVGADGALTLQPVTATLAAGTATLSGTIGPQFERVALDYEITAGPQSALHGMVATPTWDTATLTGRAEGPLTALAATLQARLTGLDAGDPALAPAIGDRLEASADATVHTGTGRIELTRAVITAGAGTATLDGTVGNWGETVDAVLGLALPDLARLSALAGQPLSGAAELRGPLTVASGNAVRAELTGSVRDLRTGTPADPLLGDAVGVAVTAGLGADGAVRLERLTVDGAEAKLSAEATLADGRLDAAARVALPRLAAVGDAVGTPMQGAATVEATASGPLDALQARAAVDARGLEAAGRRFGDTTLTATAGDLARRPNGRVEAQAQLAGLGLRLQTAYALDGNALRLSDLAVAGGRNRVSGEATVALDTLTATGRLNGALPELRALSELAGMDLQGDASFTVALDGSGGEQAATLEARAAGLRVAQPGEDLLAARRLTVSAQVQRALTAPSGKAQVRLDDGTLAGTAVTRLTASADGDPTRAAFQAKAEAPGPDGLNAELAGTLEAAGAVTTVRLDRLRASAHGESVRLAGPARLEIGTERYVVADLRLVSGNARLAADAGLVEGRLNGSVRLDRIPLALARLAAPDLPVEGTLNASADLGGTLAAPRVDARLRLDGVRARQIEEAGIAGLDASVQANWRDARLTVSGTVQPHGRSDALALRGSVPLVMDPQTMVPAVPPGSRVDAAVTGNVQLAQFNDLLATTGDRMAGRIGLNVTVGGTLDDPAVGGTVTIADARYENRASGAVLTGIDGRIVGSGDVFRIESLGGRTPGGGGFRVAGTVAPAADQVFDLTVTLNDAALLQTDLVSAAFDADLTLTGTLDRSVLAGPIRIVRANVRIPDSSPPEVVDLDVVEVGRGRRAPVPERKPGQPEAATAPAADNAAFTLALDMTVAARNQIFVRGRGLDAQFSGDLRIGGTADRPAVDGRLVMVRGDLDVLGQTFGFQRGIIAFDGNWPVDPGLDLVAQATANDVTAEIQVSGRASRPQIELSSPQGLPQDEVLARVLFGKPLNRLSAFEAVQIARSAADLAGVGGGAGFVDRLREGLGIDRLEFVQGTNGSPGGVEAGRYVSDRVYVGIEQGIGPAQSRARVEVDVTDNIKAEAGVGANADTQVGVTFEWNY